MSDSLKERVEQALGIVRPLLQRDGGDVELIGVSDDGLVSVRLAGACRGCPGAEMTLRLGIERILKEQVPDIAGVETV